MINCAVHFQGTLIIRHPHNLLITHVVIGLLASRIVIERVIVKTGIKLIGKSLFSIGIFFHISSLFSPLLVLQPRKGTEHNTAFTPSC